MSGSDAARARLFLVLLILGWGVTWPMMRISLTEIPPFSMRVGNLGLGALTLIVVARVSGRSLRIPCSRSWLHVGIASLFNIVGFSVFTPLAQLSAATSRVAIVVYTMPIWASLLARPILGEHLDKFRGMALLLCAAGMAVLIWPLALLGVPVGILLALGAAVSWAAGTVYLKWAEIDGDPMAVTVWQLIVGLVAISAALPIMGESLHLWPAHAEPLLALVFSGLVGTGISYALWFDIVRRVPATTASLGILGVPVVGIVSSVILLGEQPTLADITGFILIFAASTCVLLRPYQGEEPQARRA